MRRARLVVPALLLATAGLAGCGDDDKGYDVHGIDPRFRDYCSLVTDEQPKIAEALDRGDAVGLLYALPSFERLKDGAPSDIADDWAVVVRRIGVLRDALDDAGVDPQDYDPTTSPDGLDPDDRAAIEGAASGLLAPETAAALDTVQQEARDVCKTSLGFS